MKPPAPSLIQIQLTTWPNPFAKSFPIRRPPRHKDRVTSHVLGNYAKSELQPLSELLSAIAEAEWLAGGDDVRFMKDVAMRVDGD